MRNIQMPKPKVSILIAARNEEKNLPILLKSLDALTYPKGSLEIIFGNDDSDDKTDEILRDYANQKVHVRIIQLLEQAENEKLRGKARVLERIASQATGDYFFFTDADIRLPENWIESMLSYFTSNEVGVVTGLTSMHPDTITSALQGIEWLNVLHLMHILSHRKIPTSAMGNNMAVSKEAYWATGGYKKIDFSIIEDYALYEAIIQKKYQFKQAFEKGVLAYTKPPEKFFEQRTRWIKGGFESNPIRMLPGLFLAIQIPILIFLSLRLSLILIIGTLVFHYFHIHLLERKLNIKGYQKYFAIFAVYLAIAWFFQIISACLPSKLKWKGRSY